MHARIFRYLLQTTPSDNLKVGLACNISYQKANSVLFDLYLRGFVSQQEDKQKKRVINYAVTMNNAVESMIAKLEMVLLKMKAKVNKDQQYRESLDLPLQAPSEKISRAIEELEVCLLRIVNL